MAIRNKLINSYLKTIIKISLFQTWQNLFDFHSRFKYIQYLASMPSKVNFKVLALNFENNEICFKSSENFSRIFDPN